MVLIDAVLGLASSPCPGQAGGTGPGDDRPDRSDDPEEPNVTQVHQRPAEAVDDALVEAFRRDGVVKVPAVISKAEAARFRVAAVAASQRLRDNNRDATFAQFVDVWREDEVLRELTMHHRLAEAATRLAGSPVRLWHDQLLIKAPHNGAATEFHQDAPYWPHSEGGPALSAWVALVDVPVERGCMTFIPGSQSQRGLRAQDLTDSRDLFGLAPDLQWEARVTVPLRAGDCTFHDAYVAHTATPNLTDDPRIAHVTIFIDAQKRYTGGAHVVTDGLGLTVGEPLPDDRFPRLPLS